MQSKFIFGAFYLFFINTLFIALSAALVTILLGVPHHQSIDKRKQTRINRIVTAITVVAVVPSLLIGSNTVYNTYMEHNVSDYLKTEFAFSGTQLVQSSFDKTSKTISVSLVGMPISDETIALLERELNNYDLEGYTLHVTQNTVITGNEGDNSDKITIAIQENTIAELQKQLAEQQIRLDELENTVAAKLDFTDIAQKAESIFTDLSGCSCGMIADESGEYIILAASIQREFSDSEIAIIENWLKTESGINQVKLFLNQGQRS